MSYEELAAHATEIMEKAMKWDLERMGYIDNGDGTYTSTSSYPNGYGTTGYSSPSTGGYPAQSQVDADMEEVSNRYNDVPELFAPFTWLPDPADFDAGIEDLTAAMGRLSQGAGAEDPTNGSAMPANTVLDGMDTSQDYLARWTGLAATQFKEKFVDTFESITTNQFLLASYVKGALEAEKSLWDAARRNIDEIAEDTITALEECGDCGKNEWGMAFTVAGAVVALVAVPFTGGGSALAFAAIGGALSIGGAAVGNMDDPPELDMSGESAEAVVNNMRDAISKLKDEISKAEQKIVDKMTELTGLVNSNKDVFVAPRPNLADAGPGSIRDDMGVPR